MVRRLVKSVLKEILEEEGISPENVDKTLAANEKETSERPRGHGASADAIPRVKKGL